MIRKYVLFATLIAAACAANAQTSAPAAQQAAAQDQRQNQQMEQAALQVAKMVDQNQIAQLWDGASTVARQIVTRDVFIKGVETDRKTVGVPQARNLALLTYSQSDGRTAPPGLFANVSFATRFTNEKQPVRELISFHLDNDHVWRVTGYSLR